MRGIATINPPPSNSPYSFILGLMSVFACFGTGNRRFQMVCTACRRAFVLRRAIPVANRFYRHRQHLPLIRMHHHRTQLLMGVRARTVAMPGPQTARTVNPLGGKGAGTIHGYQIMTTPRRHPLQHFAALGALQYLLKPPPIPHQRNRIQATAQGRVAGNLRQTDRTDNADSSPPPSAAASLHQTAAARRASPETPPDPTSDSCRWKISARKPPQRPPQILHEPPAAHRACSHPCATSTYPSLDTSFVW